MTSSHTMVTMDYEHWLTEVEAAVAQLERDGHLQLSVIVVEQVVNKLFS
jgi:hypothetical protein